MGEDEHCKQRPEALMSRVDLAIMSRRRDMQTTAEKPSHIDPWTDFVQFRLCS